MQRRLQKIGLKIRNCSRKTRYTPPDLQSKKIRSKKEPLKPKTEKKIRIDFVEKEKDYKEIWLKREHSIV